MTLFLQKLLFTSDPQKVYSKKYCKSHRKTTVMEFLSLSCRLRINQTSLQFLLDEFCEIFKTSFFLERLLGLYKIKRNKFWQLPLHNRNNNYLDQQTNIDSFQAFAQICFSKELFRKAEYISKNVRGGVSF